MLDAYMLESHRRAAAATETGAFADELVAVEVDGEPHLTDEGIRADATLRVSARSGS